MLRSFIAWQVVVEKIRCFVWVIKQGAHLGGKYVYAVDGSSDVCSAAGGLGGAWVKQLGCCSSF